MSEQKFIDKDNRSPFHIDIKQLYREGIDIIQNYSGDHWTDYNEHDPGVTILEQLVFAITDLCYKMGFDTVDYLVGENGKIDTTRQALYEPHEILTSHPVTIEDYRKVIFDRIPDVSNVWIETLSETESHGISGLYRIYLYLDPAQYYKNLSDIDTYTGGLKKMLFNLWPDIRNIGEDVDSKDLIILSELDIRVYVDLVLKNSSDLEEVLAEIIFELDQYFNPILVMSTLEDMLEEGDSYDEIFEGPELSHGFIKSEVLSKKRPLSISKAKIVSIISEIEGVRQIENLRLSCMVKKEMGGEQLDQLLEIKCEDEVLDLEVEKNKILELLDDEQRKVMSERTFIPKFKFLRPIEGDNSPNPQLMRTAFDEKNQHLTVKLKKRNNEKYLDLDYEKVLKTLRRKQALHTRVYSSGSIAHHRPALPKGEYRDWSHYYSIQNHFPSIYAINQYGLSKHDSKKRQAMAMQLKGYLVLFEQLIADFQNQMVHLKDLYSVDREHMKTSYYPQNLLQSEIKDIENLYLLDDQELTTQNVEKLKGTLDQMLGKLNSIHPHVERKSRLLDYMLALYGEKFSQHTLGRVGDAKFKGDRSHLVVENKVRMLETLRYFNTNSAKAPTFGGNRSLKDMSGFEMKLAVLLGIEMNTVLNNDGHSIFSIHQDAHRRISLVPDHKWDKVAQGKLKNIQKLIKEGRLMPVPALTRSDKTRKPEDANLVKNYLIGEKMITLRTGADPNNYYIYQSNQFNQYYLLIKIHSEQRTDWHIIGSCQDYQEALIVVDILTNICKNYDIEKFTFIDHISLRPTDNTTNEVISPQDKRDFYSFNSTLIFPNWGRKFQDEAYQQLTEDTVMKTIPAHVRVNILWLDFIKYREFEKVFGIWSSDPEEEFHRENMVHFLHNNILKSQA